MNTYFHPLAKIDLNAAITYYDRQDSRIGLTFAQEIILNIGMIVFQKSN